MHLFIWRLIFHSLIRFQLKIESANQKSDRSSVVLFGKYTARASNLRQDLITVKVSYVIPKQSDWSIMINHHIKQSIIIKKTKYKRKQLCDICFISLHKCLNGFSLLDGKHLKN